MQPRYNCYLPIALIFNSEYDMMPSLVKCAMLPTNNCSMKLNFNDNRNMKLFPEKNILPWFGNHGVLPITYLGYLCEDISIKDAAEAPSRTPTREDFQSKRELVSWYIGETLCGKRYAQLIASYSDYTAILALDSEALQQAFLVYDTGEFESLDYFISRNGLDAFMQLATNLGNASVTAKNKCLSVRFRYNTSTRIGWMNFDTSFRQLARDMINYTDNSLKVIPDIPVVNLNLAAIRPVDVNVILPQSIQVLNIYCYIDPVLHSSSVMMEKFKLAVNQNNLRLLAISNSDYDMIIQYNNTVKSLLVLDNCHHVLIRTQEVIPDIRVFKANTCAAWVSVELVVDSFSASSALTNLNQLANISACTYDWLQSEHRNEQEYELFALSQFTCTGRMHCDTLLPAKKTNINLFTPKRIVIPVVCSISLLIHRTSDLRDIYLAVAPNLTNVGILLNISVSYNTSLINLHVYCGNASDADAHPESIAWDTDEILHIRDFDREALHVGSSVVSLHARCAPYSLET